MTIQMIVVRAVAAAAAMTMTACGLEAEETTAGIHELQALPVLPADCPLWGCASNAATMAHELDASGQGETEGLRFVSFATGMGVPLQLAVDGDQLKGRQGDMTLTGTSLVGAIMTVKRTNSLDDGLYYIKLEEVSKTPFWFGPVGETTPTYVFTFKRADAGDQDWQNLCSDPAPPKPGKVPPWRSIDPDWAWVGRPIAVVFSGDRYDNVRRSVSTANIAQWFNIACAGSAVAKMHLLRFTTASHNDIATSDPQRTAVLKMITDDICGTGHSFTVDGEDVLYLDWLGHHQYAFGRPQRSVEAIWTEHGAYCIWEPRRRMEDPTIWDQIDHECLRPHYCTDAELKAYWGPAEPRLGWGYSANP